METEAAYLPHTYVAVPGYRASLMLQECQQKQGLPGWQPDKPIIVMTHRRK